ncbi:MAG: hypothetical protein GC181_03465 [Bacteroidetes bacterium]|nr:hypothetical protein [Bacteroidota bacterium]
MTDEDLPYGPVSKSLSYLKFLSRAGNAHSIHSPQVFALYNLLRCAPPKEVRNAIELLRKQNLRDKRVLQYPDPGKDLQVVENSIRHMAKSFVKKPVVGKLLYQTVRFFEPSKILELGTSLGISAAWQHYANPSAEFISVEGVKAIADEAAKNLSGLGLKTQVECSLFNDWLHLAKSENPEFNYVYLDGHHKKLPTLKYFESVKSLISKNAVVVLDDIHWSKGMESAWQEIIADRDVAISIDLFHIGILIFREGVTKQHFTLFA